MLFCPKCILLVAFLKLSGPETVVLRRVAFLVLVLFFAQLCFLVSQIRSLFAVPNHSRTIGNIGKPKRLEYYPQAQA